MEDTSHRITTRRSPDGTTRTLLIVEARRREWLVKLNVKTERTQLELGEYHAAFSRWFSPKYNISLFLNFRHLPCCGLNVNTHHASCALETSFRTTKRIPEYKRHTEQQYQIISTTVINREHMSTFSGIQCHILRSFPFYSRDSFAVQLYATLYIKKNEVSTPPKKIPWFSLVAINKEPSPHTRHVPTILRTSR